MSYAEITVRDLRRQWKPHKERLAQDRDNHPTAVRFHRACSWLAEAERLVKLNDHDTALVHQWIALNALYGQWNAATRQPLPDRECWQVFLSRILELDANERVVSVLQEHKPLVLALLDDKYLNAYFWQHLDDSLPDRKGRGRQRALSWYVEGWWIKIVDQLIERIYFLRCQLIHGAASFGSQLNRTAVSRCTTMLSWLTTAILQVWIEHGSDEDWGIMCYPPIVNSPQRAPIRFNPE